MPEVEVLEMTEIWLKGIDLKGADLPQLAVLVADTLAVRRDIVFVIDVRDRRIVFDVLQPRVELAAVLGNEADLLAAMSRADGVTLLPDATVHSRDVFGAIGIPKPDAAAVLGGLECIDRGLRSYASSRVDGSRSGGGTDRRDQCRDRVGADGSGWLLWSRRAGRWPTTSQSYLVES